MAMKRYWKLSPTISAKSVGVGAVYQPWIRYGKSREKRNHRAFFNVAAQRICHLYRSLGSKKMVTAAAARIPAYGRRYCVNQSVAAFAARWNWSV